MALNAHLIAWSGDALRHIPAGSPIGVLDVRHAGRGADNRWNDPGQPTLYLARDEGAVIAEWGRHFEINRTSPLMRTTVEREVYALTLSLEKIIDLKDEAICNDLSLTNPPHCFLDMALARAVSNFIRLNSEAQGMLVPSMGFLDQPERWCLVLFLDKLPGAKSFITATTLRGPLRWG